MLLNKENILVLIATYVVVVTVARDLDLDPGKGQLSFIKKQPIEFVLLYATAWSFTMDHKLSLISMIIYYFLKYFIK